MPTTNAENKKGKAPRNRTITLSAQEVARYAAQCLTLPDGAAPIPRADLTDSIIRGDAFAALACLPDEFVDLLIVDPPYNLQKNYGDSTFRKMDAEDYIAFTERWIAAVKHTLKPTASLYVCCDWQTSLLIGGVLQRHFRLQNRITWQREKGRGAARNWKNCTEDIWFATNSARYTFHAERVKLRRRVIAPYKAAGQPKDWVETADGKYRDTFASNFWDDISIPYWSMPENTDHPAQKPEKLLAKLILASSEPGDWVLDPFLGSGTTAVAARKLGRRFVGIESQQLYCALAQKRLELVQAAPSIQGLTDGVFWERNSAPRRKGVKKG